ncbi:MAG: diguanylate cyclase [Bacillota bacterium]
MGDLFKYEKEILNQALDDIENGDYENQELFEKYKSMVFNYKKFLKQMEKVLSISDNQQKLLKETQEKLEVEVSERKYAEKLLNQKVEELEKTQDKLEQANQKLKDMSFLDGLTGIPNRRRFDKILKKEWNRSLRHNEYLSALMLDIDFFKEFNDNYGHLAGDDCLKKIAAVLSETLKRSSDFVARYGGEEFVVILPKTKQDEAVAIAEKLRKKIEEQEIRHEDSSVSEYVTVSVGVATVIVSDSLAANEFIDVADKALYQAKNNGRNQVQAIKVK